MSKNTTSQAANQAAPGSLSEQSTGSTLVTNTIIHQSDELAA